MEDSTRSDSLRGEDGGDGDGDGDGKREAEDQRQTETTGRRETASTAVQSGPRTQDPVPGARHASKSRRRLHGRIWTGTRDRSEVLTNFSSHLCQANNSTCQGGNVSQACANRKRLAAGQAAGRHRRPRQDLTESDKLTNWRAQTLQTLQTTPDLTRPSTQRGKSSAARLDWLDEASEARGSAPVTLRLAHPGPTPCSC